MAWRNLSTIVEGIIEGLPLDRKRGRNQWYSRAVCDIQWFDMQLAIGVQLGMIGWYWLPVLACYLLHANVKHLRAQKHGNSQESHSYRLVSPASRNRDHASSWTVPRKNKASIYLYIFIYLFMYLMIFNVSIHFIYGFIYLFIQIACISYCTYGKSNTTCAKTWLWPNSWPLTPSKNHQACTKHWEFTILTTSAHPLTRYEVGNCKFMGRAAELPCTRTAVSLWLCIKSARPCWSYNRSCM